MESPSLHVKKSTSLSELMTNIGKYHIGRMIGAGTFAKVKFGVNLETNQYVAVKVIDKMLAVKNKLMDQVMREISTMKLLNHPNIVKIHEVIATKSKIYLIMEYVSGGQLSDKKSSNENEARKWFQQLIDAVDYCHARGVYHRDLKPENLLLDHKGNLKVIDFGLSVLRKKPGDLLSTTCGSPSYVAPEVLVHRQYEGAAADIWSCGIILFELLAGYPPFEDHSIMNLYRKIARADFTFPTRFTATQRSLLSTIMDPWPPKRARIADILKDEWFQTGNEPSQGSEIEESTSSNSNVDKIAYKDKEKAGIINAFQLIAMSNDLNLSGLFLEQDHGKQNTKQGSNHSVNETIGIIEATARGASLSARRINDKFVRIHQIESALISNLHQSIFVEIIEVTPAHCIVEITKPAVEINVYEEFCNCLLNVLKISTNSLSLTSNNI